MSRQAVLALVIVFGGPAGCLQTATPGTGAARNDVEYCDRLIDMYSRYLSGDELGQRRAAADNNLDGRIAVAKCEQGDTATGIPILERKLVANGFTLPRRN